MMLIGQDLGTKKNTTNLFVMLCFIFVYQLQTPFLYGLAVDVSEEFDSQTRCNRFWGRRCKSEKTLTYYLNVSDFAQSFIEINTSNVAADSSTIASSYLAGRAAIYNENNEKFGTCSASFLNMQNADGIFTDISNYIAADNGLIVTWFTPTKLVNLELDSIIHSMVTECIVLASTKVGFNPFYGQEFNLVVSSNGGRIYFEFTRRKS